MKFESYDAIRNSDDLTSFEFVSTGPRGNILKRICFHPTPDKEVFELTFGDVMSNDDIDYYSITDNRDRDRILATIASTIGIFLSTYPNAIVCFKGSTQIKTRIYRMAIDLNLNELEIRYEIFGLYDDQWMPFRKNIEVSAFYIRKRT